MSKRKRNRENTRPSSGSGQRTDHVHAHGALPVPLLIRAVADSGYDTVSQIDPRWWAVKGATLYALNSGMVTDAEMHGGLAFFAYVAMDYATRYPDEAREWMADMHAFLVYHGSHPVALALGMPPVSESEVRDATRKSTDEFRDRWINHARKMAAGHATMHPDHD